MDPLSAIALAQSVLSIVGVIAKNVNALSTLQAKYRNADLSVFLLIGQLSTLKAALGQISEWIKIEGDTAQSKHLQLFEDLKVALNGCQVLISILDDRVDHLANKEGSDNLKDQGKIVFLWEEQELNVYVTHLNNQVNALTLLLSAIQCRSLSQERTLLQSLESRHVIQRLRDNTSSLLCLRDSESILSRKTVSTFNSKLLETVFDFDGEVFNSRAYQVALRSNMKQVLSHKALGHSKPSDLAPPITNDTLLLENDEVNADTETIKAKSESDASLIPIPIPVYQDIGSYTPKKVSLWSRLSEQIVSRQKSQLRARNQTINFPGVEPQQDLLPWNGKTLILGTSESGKSTLLKSVKLYMEGPYSLEERSSFKEIIFSNAVQSMRMVLEAMESLELLVDDELSDYRVQPTEYHVQTIFMQPLRLEIEQLPAEVVNAIENLYMDSGVQECLNRARREYQLNDAAEYYFRSILRLGGSDYIPTAHDILRSRVKTTGITETTFDVGGQEVFLFDVGGVRSERKLWIHVFEDVGAILFTVDIASYDQLLFEDETVNRVQEALRLFDSIVNSRWFKKTAFALLFTKYDKLAVKLKASPLKYYFPDFKGRDDLEEATAYITNRFVSLSRHDDRTIEVFYTSIVDDERSLGKTAIDFLQRIRYDYSARGEVGKATRPR
ncbi:guanine nucleotide-binding protein subunit alpha [Xylographa trunciseda]|nr:guanine nucleotide-binding protein subunit alpha [Xylographa trunciseda]